MDFVLVRGPITGQYLCESCYKHEYAEREKQIAKEERMARMDVITRAAVDRAVAKRNAGIVVKHDAPAPTAGEAHAFVPWKNDDFIEE